MKILIVITKSELGGAQVFALNLARGLKAAGEEVTVAGGPGDYLPSELAKSDITFKRLNKLERSHNPLKSLSFIAELKQYVAREGFDVVHLNSTNALLGVWGMKQLKPQPRLVFTVHGLSLIDSGHQTLVPLKIAYRLFFRAAFKQLDKLVFVSHLNLDFAKTSGLLNNLEAKSQLIYNGLDLAPNYLLSREAARQALKISPEAYVYGSIGRLAYPKNYEFLINNFKAVKTLKPQAKLLLIGEGPERAKYESLIKMYELDNEVILAGEIKEASRYLLAFDLFVLPSVFEGLSLSLIEASQAGIPAIASRVGGSEEIVGINNCFKVNDSTDFLRLIKGNNFKINNQTDFSGERMIKDYLRIYSD